VPLTLLGYGILLTLLGCWVLGAADAAGYWVLLMLLSCCDAGVLHKAIGYWFVC